MIDICLQVDIFMNGEHVETMSPSVPDEPHPQKDRETRTHEAAPRISTSYKLCGHKLSVHKLPRHKLSGHKLPVHKLYIHKLSTHKLSVHKLTRHKLSVINYININYRIALDFYM